MNSILAFVAVASIIFVKASAHIGEFEQVQFLSVFCLKFTFLLWTDKIETVLQFNDIIFQVGLGATSFKPQFDVSPVQSRAGGLYEQFRGMQNQYGSSPKFQYTGRNQILEKRPQSPWQSPLRNCYLSPVQCLLPVQQHQFNKFHKRFML